jgi:hypothetical protein
MGGIDQRIFKLNDYFGLNVTSPSNDARFIVTVQADVNGYTWAVTRQNSVVAGGTRLYGDASGQFATQALMYT